ncbi:chaplin family protein [Hamadaea sp. NPDC050747]|uniref:chaplin family protein n=1 Tax=Hamadaea sp. NPDC050747 TaxID=3155789 RepID=UPI0033E16DB5
MNSWARKSLKAGAISAGFLLAGASAAHASDLTTSNNVGIGNGTQVDAHIQAPINVCGNAISVLGSASAGCVGGAWANHTGELGDLTSSDNFGLLNGTQIRALLQAPIDACGNAIGVGGSATAWCTGGSWAKQESAKTESGTLTSTQNVGLLNGTQVLAPIQIPIDLCGNAIGVLGGASAGCVGGSHASLDAESLPDAWTGLNFGIGNGTQLIPLIQIPIDICGNAVAVLGSATASCQGGADAVIGDGPSGHGPDTYVKDKPVHHNTNNIKKKHVKGGKKTEGLPLVGDLVGTLSGLTGNLAGSGARTLPAPAAKHGGYGHDGGSCANLTSAMNAGILNGTQVLLPVQAPIDISGNAVAVGGSSVAHSTGGATATLTC